MGVRRRGVACIGCCRKQEPNRTRPRDSVVDSDIYRIGQCVLCICTSLYTCVYVLCLRSASVEQMPISGLDRQPQLLAHARPFSHVQLPSSERDAADHEFHRHGEQNFVRPSQAYLAGRKLRYASRPFHDWMVSTTFYYPSQTHKHIYRPTLAHFCVAVTAISLFTGWAV